MKKLLFFVAFSVGTVNMQATMSEETTVDTIQTIRPLVCAMPDSLIPYLSENNRLDLFDFYDANMPAEVTNLLNGRSRLLSLTDDTLSLQVSSAMRVDMFLLPTTELVDSSRSIVCLVRSYTSDSLLMETDVSFYSARWRNLLEVPLSEADRKRVAKIKLSKIANSYKNIINKD